MSNVIFVNLRDSYNDHHTSVDMLGILSLATVVKENSLHRVEIIDFQHEYLNGKYRPVANFDDELRQQLNFIMERSPDILCFYTMCNNYHVAIALSREIKECFPNVKIIFGGPQATLTAEDTIANIDWIDAVSIGEGETSIVKIIDVILNNSSCEDVTGIVFKKGNEIIKNSSPTLIVNMDELPDIDYTFLDMSKIQSVDIDAGRGCPFSCTFCSTKSFWNRKFRLKSPKRIVNEMLSIKNKYGIHQFSLTHDLFTANKVKVIEFCDLLIDLPFSFKWGCSSRVDTLDEMTITKMAEAGCHDVFLGVETGSQRMQKIINKNLKLDKLRPTLKLLKSNNIRYVLSFIYGFPDETIQDINETLNLVVSLVQEGLVNFRDIQMHELSFFPGTELLKEYEHQLEYSTEHNATMINKIELPSYLHELIRNNRAVFPYFFKRESDFCAHMQGLDKFMTFILMRTINKYAFTLTQVFKFFNYDFVALFKAYQVHENEVLNQISFYNDQQIRDTIINSIHSMKRFIESIDFAELDFEIKEILEFEYDIVEFLHFSELDEQDKKYSTNVYEALKQQKLSSSDEVTIIRFNRENNGEISVLRLD